VDHQQEKKPEKLTNQQLSQGMLVICWHRDLTSSDHQDKDQFITAGKTYAIEGWTNGKPDFIQIHNDLGQLSWYRAYKFDANLKRDPSSFHVPSPLTNRKEAISAEMAKLQTELDQLNEKIQNSTEKSKP